MIERKTLIALFISACVLAPACLFSQSTSARVQAPAGKGAEQGGAPLKGVEVKLARYAGAQSGDGGMSVVASTTSDAEGKFKLPVVPAGRYVLILEAPKVSNDVGAARQSVTKLDGKIGQMETPLDARVHVTLNLPGNKKVEKGYDFARRQAFDPLLIKRGESSEARMTGQLADLTYESDGVTPCEGAINTTRSNIKNTFE